MTGAEPLALTDNLNFGNPHNPENFYQLQQAVDGLAEGCRAFDIPVTGGNVSLYNQSPAGAIDPTPTVGIVGIIRDPAHITPSHFQGEGDAVVLVGQLGDELGASLYLREIHNLKRGHPPELNLDREMKMHEAVRTAIRAGLPRSAHDLAEGGLLVALAECAIAGAKQLGATVRLDLPHSRLDALLFGESQSRAVLTVPAEKLEQALALFEAQGVPAKQIGTVGGNQLNVHVFGGSSSHAKLSWPVDALHSAWHDALDTYLA
jgi:phosphoribosylformylglycinamidine (FGAM) synthase-like enzyme